MFWRLTRRNHGSPARRRATAYALCLEGLEGRALLSLAPIDSPLSTIGLPDPSSIAYGTSLSSAQIDATASMPGTFTYSPPAGTILTAGVHTLTVTFTPADSIDYTTATATTTITVAKAVPTVDVAGGGGVADAPIPVTATVAGVDATPSPSLEGVRPALTYYAGTAATGTPLGSQPTTVGTYTVVASFPGSTDYAGASSRPLTFTTTTATATVLLGTSAGSTVYGQAITLTATVSVAAPAAAPTGSVTFYDDAATLGSAPLDALGHAVLTVGSLGPGGHSITAVYGGDARSSGGRSGADSESVSPADSQITFVPHAVLGGKGIASVILTAMVEPLAGGGGVPTGVVTFMVKKKVLGRAALIDGRATLTVRPGSVLNQAITVVYGGTDEFRSSSLSVAKVTSRSLVIDTRPAVKKPQARPKASTAPGSSRKHNR
jgi:hypothetical protein